MLKQYVDPSDRSAPRETQAEFAALLRSSFRGTSLYQKWKDAFMVVYNKSIDDLARIGDEQDAKRGYFWDD